MPPRMTQESCRPRVSDRTMVGNSATRLACEFQRTERRRHDSEHETTGMGKNHRLVAPAAYRAAPRQAKTAKQLKKKCRQYGGGLDAGKIFLAFRQGEVFFT